MMQATAFEYRYRHFLHGLILLIGFAGPWHRPMWSFAQNGSALFLIANVLAKPSYQHFAAYWNSVVAILLLLAALGAWLRIWAVASVGTSAVQQGTMAASHLVADGPYRFTRNPLYIGACLNTIALAFLMRPEAGILTVLLVVVLQYRLIAREEVYLAEQFGAAYIDYKAAVPKLLPTLRPKVISSGNRPTWIPSILGEIFSIGCALAFAAFGWSTGYGWEGSIVKVMQAILISLGLAIVARALRPSGQASTG